MKAAHLPLKHTLFIYYPIRFKKVQAIVQALIDFGSELNAINPAYPAKLGLKVCLTDVGAQKFDGSNFKIIAIVLTSFQVENKLGKIWFFSKNLPGGSHQQGYYFENVFFNSWKGKCTVCQEETYLEDLHSVWGFINYQVDSNHWLKRIWGSSTRFYRRNFCSSYSFPKFWVKTDNIPSLKDLDCFVGGQKSQCTGWIFGFCGYLCKRISRGAALALWHQ